jgi:hypothetical protein
MAKRRRRRSRRFGDYVSVPLGLGKFKLPGLKALNPLGKSVNATDVLVGAGIGMAGGLLIQKAIAKFWPTAPAFVLNNIGPISTIGAGAVALAVLKNKHKATGYLTGAALVGLAPLGWEAIGKLPFLSDYVNVDYGMLTDVNPMGLLVDEGSASLSELAAYSMGQGEDDYSYVP